jgi:hypothetical protein
MKRVCRAMWCVIFSLATYCHAEHEVRLLVFVIANDQDPIYVELQKIWRAYMHLDPEHVDAYFIKADPHLDAEHKIKGDVIWSRTEESIFPGILNKTLLSLEAIGTKLDEYDYFLRTNLSSFYVFPRLLHALKHLPKNRFCFSFGIPHFQPIIISGAGYILSQDMTKLALENKNILMNVREYDDICLGHFFTDRGVPVTRHERIDLLTLKDYINNKNKITNPKNFQFRIKNPKENLRLKHDIFIQKQLLKTFYNINSEE